MRVGVIVLVSVLAIVMVSGCVAQGLEFETVSRGAYSGHPEEGRYVVNSQAEWEGLWNRTNSITFPVPDLPEVDFSQSTIIAVFLGQRNTGGYGIEVVEILAQDGGALVRFHKTSPPAGSFVTQALTQPYHIVKVSKVEGEVSFEEV